MKEIRESFYMLLFYIPKMKEGALMFLKDCLLKNGKILNYSIIRKLGENSKLPARPPDKRITERLDKFSDNDIERILKGFTHWLPQMDASDLLFMKDWIIENNEIFDMGIINRLEKRMKERYSSFLQRRSKVESHYDTKWW